MSDKNRKKTDKKPTKTDRRKIVKRKLIEGGGKINKSELASELGCHRTTLTKDIEDTKALITQKAVDKYAERLLEEITQGQNLVRMVINNSIGKDDNGKVEIKCGEDVLLDRILKAGKIKESDAKVLEAWFFKDKAMDHVKHEGLDGLAPSELVLLVEKYNDSE